MQNSSLSSKPFRTAYGPKLKVELVTPPGEGRTKQSFKDECDINRIMARYLKTGVLEYRQAAPQYADLIGVDFTAAMDVIARGKSMFSQLPAELRDRFENNPARLLSFLDNPRNRVEAEELGLINAQEPQGDAQPKASTPPSAPPPADAGNEAVSGPKGAAKANRAAPPPKGD